MNKTTPIILITGFLGAGKTTFINYVLENNPDKKISLILNEFGDIKLESEFIEKKDIGMVSELSGGCLCCVARVDLPRVVRYTLEQAPVTDYLIIEASGLSDPDPVRATLADASLSDLIKLDTVVAIVDGENFTNTYTTHPLVMSQIADADLALISKSKNLSPQNLVSLVEKVSHIGTGTRTLVWDEQFDSSVIFDPPLTTHVAKQGDNHTHESYEEYWYQDKVEHDIEDVRNNLASLPDTILRVKGFTDNGKARYLVQKVGNHVDIRETTSKGSVETVILVIGTELNIYLLKQTFIK